jgi:hypothetical protein
VLTVLLARSFTSPRTARVARERLLPQVSGITMLGLGLDVGFSIQEL